MSAHPPMPRGIQCPGIYHIPRDRTLNTHGSMPITFEIGDDLSNIERWFPHLAVWVVKRYRLECYAQKQHAHCDGRWLKEIQE